MSDDPADHTHTFAELRRDAEIALHQMISRCGVTIDPDLLSHSGMFYAVVDGMAKIVREMAETEPSYENDVIGQMECPYCNATSRAYGAPFPHEADCIITKARVLVGKKEAHHE